MSVEQFLCIFSDEGLNHVYEEFLQKNMAWENFGFYLEVQKFRSTQDQQQRIAVARDIFEKYVEVDSAHELGDITFELRQHVKECLDSGSIRTFDELCDIVVDSLVNSTISDFLCDALFTDYVEDQFARCAKTNNVEQRGFFFTVFSCIS